MVLFNSPEFIFRFLPVFLLIYYLTPARHRDVTLLTGSVIFYTAGAGELVLALIALTVANYFLGAGIYRSRAVSNTEREGAIFLGALFLDGGTLLICKMLASYFRGYSLPLGFSFYIFKMISYQCDLVRGDIKTKPSLLSTAVYFSMFPQVTQGPIMRYSAGQFDCEDGRKISAGAFANGVYFFVLGLGMKVLLADRLHVLWNEIGKIGYESISTPLAWMGVFGYSLELYMDFWGYSLMAAGLGMMLGFKFIANFLHPYMATGVADFYRRWHVTLGSWFRDYLYIPLGGSRAGRGRTVFNLLVVWLLTGVWHGITLNYLIWSLVLALVILWEKFVIHDLMGRYRLIGRIHVLLLIPLTWVVFAITDVQMLGVYFSRLFPIFGGGTNVNPGDFMKLFLQFRWILLACVVLCIPAVYKWLVIKRNTVVMTILAVAIFWYSIYYITISAGNPFMYFNF